MTLASPTCPPPLPPPRSTCPNDEVIDLEILDLSEFEAEFADPTRRSGKVGRIVRFLLIGFVAFLLAGNGLIFVATLWAKHTAPASTVEVPDEVAAISNFEAVDPVLWRGGAPSVADYRALGDAGVTTVIDLRAEEDLAVPMEVLADEGMELVSIPIRDGQAPSAEKVQLFLDTVARSDGAVYVHCGAGVGRTGTMVAAYRAMQGQSGLSAMRANLAVGPPSLEQLAFAASVGPGGDIKRPNAALVAMSRTLDAPRRLWKVFEGL